VRSCLRDQPTTVQHCPALRSTGQRRLERRRSAASRRGWRKACCSLAHTQPPRSRAAHREEKNQLGWLRAQAESRLCSGDALNNGGVRITTLKELKGEAAVSTRKATKRLAVYDLSLTLAWEGWDEETGTAGKGELKVTDFASANEAEEYIWSASVEGKGAAHEALRQKASALKEHVFAVLAALVAEMLDA
jgi:hypothetical protein